MSLHHLQPGARSQCERSWEVVADHPHHFTAGKSRNQPGIKMIRLLPVAAHLTSNNSALPCCKWTDTPHLALYIIIIFYLFQVRSWRLSWQQGQMRTLEYFLTFLGSDSFVCLCFDPVCLLQEVTSFSARNGWTSHSSFLAVPGGILVTVTRFLTPEEKTVKSLLAGCGRGKYFAGLISWNWQALLRTSSSRE